MLPSGGHRGGRRLHQDELRREIESLRRRLQALLPRLGPQDEASRQQAVPQTEEGREIQEKLDLLIGAFMRLQLTNSRAQKRSCNDSL